MEPGDPDVSTPSATVTFETAMEHVSPRMPVTSPGRRVGEVLGDLLGKDFDVANHVVVCREGRFQGIVPLEVLLAADEETPIDVLMDRDAPRVGPGVDQELAAWEAVRHGESSLAVVDAEGGFRGLIPPHQMLAVLLTEHHEDLARLGGMLKNTAVARAASREPIRRRFWHRLPWLLLGLAGALLAAEIVGWFEGMLRERVALAFFVPGVVYLADAVGTQTETLVVRGLSVGVEMREMIRREALTGVAIGLTLSLVALPLVWWRWGGGEVAVGVGLAIFAACSTATVVAVALPGLFERAGLDPAFGSGPLATVVQDLLSLLLYFGIVASAS